MGRTIAGVAAGLVAWIVIATAGDLGDRFPVWDHAVFLISLLVATPLGARLVQRSAKR